MRFSGRAFEAIEALRGRRARMDLYHSALVVHSEGTRYVIEMTPAWGARDVARGVVLEGPVTVRPAGVVRAFRYEVRRWRDGVIVDADMAVGGPLRLSDDPAVARRVLALVPQLPTATWGRDTLKAGGMWNSNSMIAWLLERAGLDPGAIPPPTGGRAPGWRAGVVVARRATRA